VRASLVFAIATATWFSPVSADALTLRSAGGLNWDIDDRTGVVGDGTSDAYDGCFGLTVEDVSVSGASTTTLSGRQLVIGPVTVRALEVTRYVYVPPTGGDWIRYVDVVANRGTAASTARVSIACNLGSDGSETIFGTSTGDTLCTTADSWCASDDTEAGGDPALGFVFQGDTRAVSVSSVALGRGLMDYAYMVTVPAGGRVALAHFGIQKTSSRADVLAEARALAEAPDAAFVGVEEILDDIQNFQISVPGAPRIRFDAPFSAREGDAIPISVMVSDAEGDPVTWTWDLDGDGTFGEHAGAASLEVPAGTTDGPGAIRIGVEATDGRHRTQRYRTVNVENVPPRFEGPEPPGVTSVDATYRVQLMAVDPAGPLDPLTYRLVTGPAGLAVSPTGLVQWTPGRDAVTGPAADPHRITVSVDDGDMGTAEFTWSLRVAPNRLPTPPRPLYPTGGLGVLGRAPRLAVENATDPDFDALTYEFEIDSSPTLDSAERRTVRDVAQTPGFTAWTVNPPLSVGHWFWRARAHDRVAAGEWSATVDFFVVPDGTETVDLGVPAVDAGTADGAPPPPPPPRRSERGGCSVAQATAGRGGATTAAMLSPGAALLLAMGAARARRSRRRPVSR
jgi:hypothetical protein